MHASDESALEIHEIINGATYDKVVFTAASLANAPADGDFVEFTDYDQAAATQVAQHAYQCDAGGALGTAGDNAHVRE